jgi:peptide/nickel transport system substrate-binding protein
MKAAKLVTVVMAGIIGAGAASDALAQKSADTVRIALIQPIKRLSSYYYPEPEQGMFSREIEEPLIRYDESEAKFIPTLATSWKRIDDRTLEFQLRDGVKFHNGNTFSADDVVYMFNWRTDPKLRIPFATRFEFFEGIEKTGPMSVRIRTKAVSATDMMTLAYNLMIEDSQVHSKLQDKSEYGLNPIGTGPIKIEKLDQNAGISVVPYDGNTYADKIHYKRLIGVPIPDAQTQAAHILSGSIDAIQPQTGDELDNYKKQQNLKAISRGSFSLLWLGLDTRNRSGRPELQDERVRRAIFMAIDRKAIAENFVPGNAEVIDALCFPGMLACASNTKPPAFDPAGAKKLLAEAGYANGFDLELVTRGLSRPAGVAITGYLRAIGIRASIKHMTLNAYREYREEGKIQSIVTDSPVGSTPDASNVMIQQFGSAARDFAVDDDIQTWMQAAITTHDVAQRKQYYAKIHDRIFEKSYLLPVSSWPVTWVVNKDLEMLPPSWNDASMAAHDFAWKK